MAHASIDGSSVPEVPIPARGRSPWVRGLACVAMLPLLGFIGQTGHSLWGEWQTLRIARVSERASVVVGYVSINPNPSYASRPIDWLHDEGNEVVLWAGWKDGENKWFRFDRGEIEEQGFSLPIGRDVIRAIDFPLFEKSGGDRWNRVPDEALVAGIEGDEGTQVYPFQVLDKVEVVNDRLGDRPILVAYTPVEKSVSIYEATLEGRRVTMGLCGCFIGHNPVLYDRATESLWVGREEGMSALAGRRKGATLKRIARLGTVSWSDWRDRHPDSRLLIGADRSQPQPTD